MAVIDTGTSSRPINTTPIPRGGFFIDCLHLPVIALTGTLSLRQLYNTLATPGSTATQQSYIDAYYSLLSTVGGPYPA
jgi:hypothetical protein